MKVSVSLPDEAVEFLDAYAEKAGSSRSAAVHEAVRLLRTTGLSSDYEAAWDEWEASDDSALWDSVAADGLG